MGDKEGVWGCLRERFDNEGVEVESFKREGL